MSSAKILNAYFEASEEDRKQFLRVLSHFYKDNRRVPLQEGMESFAVNMFNLRKINGLFGLVD